MSDHYLIDLVKTYKGGNKEGVCSICSAHPFVIAAALEQARDDHRLALIEATCNQVNQFGGYTGMKPNDFRELVHSQARRIGFPEGKIILGGDHLGPHPWRTEPAQYAMEKASRMVCEYVRAGFTKIHLDASMHLGGDNDVTSLPLEPEIIAERAVVLCQSAEEAYRELKASGMGIRPPVYVIGTEVPAPGGIDNDDESITITGVNDLETTIAATREAFERYRLSAAWDRVVAVVVQPGVEFGDQKVFAYDRTKARELSIMLSCYLNLVFEGHSTDYQEASALRQMVEDGIAILKVGPALTFAFREAVFSLCLLEEELLSDAPGIKLSRIPDVLEQVMKDKPEHWQSYYRGNDNELTLARKYSLLDRCRYYWPEPGVQRVLIRLMNNLRNQPIPLSLLHQFFPDQVSRIRRGLLTNDPEALIRDKIKEVLRDYSFAISSG